MTQDQLTLLPFYKGWDVYQGYLTTAVAPLTDEQLAIRLAPHLRSIGELAVHILGCRAGWFHYVLHEGGDEIAELATLDEQGKPSPTASDLVRGLETTWNMIQDALSRWTPADLNEVFHDTNENGEDVAVTRQWVIWHLIEHDLHHGGEMFFTMGVHGLATPDL